jgi:hypothetical protein
VGCDHAVAERTVTIIEFAGVYEFDGLVLEAGFQFTNLLFVINQPFLKREPVSDDG